MKLLVVVVAAPVVLLSGCSSAASVGRADVTAAAAPASQTGVRVIEEYDLYVHCGVREARIGSDYYAADPVLDDGNGNPPRGWGNPSQVGTMTVHPEGTAVFTAGRLRAHFVLRQGAKDWLKICA